LFFAILAEFRQKLLLSYSELPHQMQTNVTTASVIDYGLGQLIYKHFNIFFLFLILKEQRVGALINLERTQSMVMHEQSLVIKNIALVVAILVMTHIAELNIMLPFTK